MRNQPVGWPTASQAIFDFDVVGDIPLMYYCALPYCRTPQSTVSVRVSGMGNGCKRRVMFPGRIH